MQNVNLFELSSIFETESEGGTLAYPNVSFVKETNELFILSKNLPSDGFYIYTTNDKFVEASDWDTSNNDNAVGIAVINNGHNFVIDKTLITTSGYYGGFRLDIEDIITYDINDATNDFNGYNNTQVMYNVLKDYTDELDYCTGTIATDVVNKTYPNGQSGYIGAAGEWQIVLDNLTEIESMLSLIGGTLLDYQQGEYGTTYQTSTEVGVSDNAIAMCVTNSSSYTSDILQDGKHVSWPVRAFITLNGWQS